MVARVQIVVTQPYSMVVAPVAALRCGAGRAGSFKPLMHLEGTPTILHIAHAAAAAAPLCGRRLWTATP